MKILVEQNDEMEKKLEKNKQQEKGGIYETLCSKSSNCNCSK
jgi:hypothetical protein